jgi:hypothetical protein
MRSWKSWLKERPLRKVAKMEIQIPLNQMLFFVALISLSFLFSKFRLGLSIVFGFSFYWAFVFNRDLLALETNGSETLYLVSGAVVVLLALVSLLSEAGFGRKGERITRFGR